jgi:phage protein D
MPARVPFYQVKIEGRDITPWVSGVTAVEDDRQADSVSITVPDPRMLYGDSLIEGSEAEIDMGYAGDGQHALMLRAVITKVEQSYPEGGVPALTLKGEDKSILMGLVERKRVWRNRKVTDIVKAVARPYRFEVTAQLSPDKVPPRAIVQDGKTDLAFLQELATQYHAKCFVELDKAAKEVLYFIPERRVVSLNRPDELVLAYRTGPASNLLSFSPSFDSSYIDRRKEIADIDRQGRKVKTQDKPPASVVVWDLDKELLEVTNERDKALVTQLYQSGIARKRDLGRKLASRRATIGRAAADSDDLESTNDTLEALQLGMTASGTAIGNIWLRAKSAVHVAGVHARFSGRWYVSNVTHKIEGGAYTTDFKCVR